MVGLAQDHDTMVQTHAAEGYYEVNHALREHGCRPTEYLDQIGGLSSRIIAAHSVLLSDREVELFAEHGVGVAHCPSGNFMMLGATKLPLMRRLGVPIGLGSDGAAGGSIDLLREMWVSYVGQITHYGAPKMDRSVTSPQQVLNMATLGGARVVGLADEIGSLEAGKRADLIVIDATGLDCLPVTDPYTTTVNCFSGHRSIDTVIINGQLVMQDGVILTVDEEELKQEVAERAKHLQQRFLASLH
jgi:5-methylthioadenosine/S-adenosylhomocysteine deaminase